MTDVRTEILAERRRRLTSAHPTVELQRRLAVGRLVRFGS